MVSFQAQSPLNHQRKTISYLETTSPFKKRKWDDTQPHDHDHHPEIKRWINYNSTPYDHNPKTSTTISSSAIDLQLETPLPSEWQRCLDIQSGEIHFYNTRTHKRTLKDPRPNDDERSPFFSAKDPSSAHDMSLDLELNLPCGSRHNNGATNSNNNRSNNSTDANSLSTLSLFTTSSTSTVVYREQQEMVAAACKRCHMLVMLCKSSPACPNCKFMHPPDRTPPKLFKPRLGFSC